MEQGRTAAAAPWEHEAHPYDLPVLRRRTAALLAAGVPLSLLLDLADPEGPHSERRFGREAGDADRLQAV